MQTSAPTSTVVLSERTFIGHAPHRLGPLLLTIRIEQSAGCLHTADGLFRPNYVVLVDGKHHHAGNAEHLGEDGLPKSTAWVFDREITPVAEAAPAGPSPVAEARALAAGLERAEAVLADQQATVLLMPDSMRHAVRLAGVYVALTKAQQAMTLGEAIDMAKAVEADYRAGPKGVGDLATSRWMGAWRIVQALKGE